MIRRLRLVFTLIFLSFFSITYSQNTKLTGKVVNAKNEPLPGVSVKITGTGTGTSTDGEGRFTLNLKTGQKYELQFSAIGYESKKITETEVIAGGLNELNITLEIQAKTGAD